VFSLCHNHDFVFGSKFRLAGSGIKDQEPGIRVSSLGDLSVQLQLKGFTGVGCGVQELKSWDSGVGIREEVMGIGRDWI
jgi:hypothetical protein